MHKVVIFFLNLVWTFAGILDNVLQSQGFRLIEESLSSTTSESYRNLCFQFSELGPMLVWISDASHLFIITVTSYVPWKLCLHLGCCICLAWIICYDPYYTDLQQIPGIMHTVLALLCFVVVMYWQILPLFFKVTSLALGQSYQGYFTGIGAIIWLPQCQWSNLEECGQIPQVNTLRTFDIMEKNDKISNVFCIIILF